MPDAAARPTICLNMIVKNEASIIHESLESVAPYIDYWVIVDTGSEDGTPEAIHTTMARLGIPGELHRKPWQNFGHNRTEALQLAHGHCDYILVNDADDVLDGIPDFRNLTADGYFMRMEKNDGVTYWQLHLFRDGLPWRYVGVTHEYATCDGPHTNERLPGDYRIRYRQLGSNSIGSNKLERDRKLLWEDIQRRPDDARSTFYLARSFEWLGEYDDALEWFERRIAMGGWEEEVYCSMFKAAEMMGELSQPWAAVEDAYLRAWAYRPSRPEALNAIAFHHRSAGQYELGYLFAARGAQIPFPESDLYFFTEARPWRALDEKSICAWEIGRRAEALSTARQILADDDLPDGDRARIKANLDFMVSEMIHRNAEYPAELVSRPAARQDAEVTVSLTAGAGNTATEYTLNSFLRCFTDSARVGRFLIIDTGLSAAEKSVLTRKYPFLDFIVVPGADLNIVRQQIGGRYWLHLWHGWRFFTEEALITRLIDVLETEPNVYQVGVNLGDALKLDADSPARTGVHTTPSGNRYVISDTTTAGPAMLDTVRLADMLAGLLEESTATLDEVLCIHYPQ